MLLENRHAWRLEHFPGEPVSVPNYLLSEEIFPNPQPDPSLTQLHAVLLGTVTRKSCLVVLSPYLLPSFRHTLVLLQLSWIVEHRTARATCEIEPL